VGTLKNHWEPGLFARGHILIFKYLNAKIEAGGGLVRTTIELSNEKRARLLAIAARRGLRGYSQLIDEALDLYLAREEERKTEELKEILSLAGTLTDSEAAAVKKRIEEVWRKWQS
jgi:metal-responsive CopG/Arc/MetJ family transcriptional regulator